MKKRLPIAVLQRLRPLIDEFRQFIIIESDDRFAFSFRDSDELSDFYFQCMPQDDHGKFDLTYKPISLTSIRGNRISGVEPLVVANLIETWLETLKVYRDTPSFWDDPVTDSFEADFAGFFVIQDADADTVSFDVPQQAQLVDYLHTVSEILENHRPAATGEAERLLLQMAASCESLKADVRILTKNQTLKRLNKIWARARKFGLPLLAEMMTEFRKEGYKAIFKTIVTADYSFLSGFVHYIGSLSQ